MLEVTMLRSSVLRTVLLNGALATASLTAFVAAPSHAAADPGCHTDPVEWKEGVEIYCQDEGGGFGAITWDGPTKGIVHAMGLKCIAYGWTNEEKRGITGIIIWNEDDNSESMYFQEDNATHIPPLNVEIACSIEGGL